MNFLDLKRVLFTFGLWHLTKRECKIRAFIWIMLMNLPVLFLLFIFFKANAPLLFYFVSPFPFPYLVLTLGMFYTTFFYYELENKYDLYSDIRLGGSFTFNLLTLSYMAPGLFLMSLTSVPSNWGVFVGLGLGLAFLVPMVLMFFRIGTFSDDSCWLYDSGGNKLGLVFGYNPTIYCLVSVFIGLYGYFNGFKVLGSANVYLIGVWLLVVFLFQLVLLFPDKVNNRVSFEVKTKKGCAMFLLGAVLLFFIFVICCQSMLLGHGFIFRFSVYGVLRWLIIVMVAFVLYKVIMKKYNL